MSVLFGRDLALEMEVDGTFKPLAGLRARSLTMSAQPIATEPLSELGWASAMDGEAERWVAVSGTARFRDASSIEAVRMTFFSQTALPLRLTLPGWGRVSAAMRVTKLKLMADFTEELRVELALRSTGAATFQDDTEISQ